MDNGVYTVRLTLPLFDGVAGNWIVDNDRVPGAHENQVRVAMAVGDQVRRLFALRRSEGGDGSAIEGASSCATMALDTDDRVLVKALDRLE